MAVKCHVSSKWCFTILKFCRFETLDFYFLFLNSLYSLSPSLPFWPRPPWLWLSVGHHGNKTNTDRLSCRDGVVMVQLELWGEREFSDEMGRGKREWETKKRRKKKKNRKKKLLFYFIGKLHWHPWGIAKLDSLHPISRYW